MLDLRDCCHSETLQHFNFPAPLHVFVQSQACKHLAFWLRLVSLAGWKPLDLSRSCRDPKVLAQDKESATALPQPDFHRKARLFNGCSAVTCEDWITGTGGWFGFSLWKITSPLISARQTLSYCLYVLQPLDGSVTLCTSATLIRTARMGCSPSKRLFFLRLCCYNATKLTSAPGAYLFHSTLLKQKR